MNGAFRTLKSLARECAGALASVLLWVLWLLLGLLALLQVYFAVSSDIAVPGFVIDSLEKRMAPSGIHFAFDSAVFDPEGRILMRQPRIFISGASEPVVTARAAFVSLNPWLLAAGRFIPRDVRLVDGAIQVPAIFSSSGRTESVVSDVDAEIRPGISSILIPAITARVGPVQVFVHGTMAVLRSHPRPPGELAKLLRERFKAFSRIATESMQPLSGLENPSLDVELSASEWRSANLSLRFEADGFKIQRPIAVQVYRLRAEARVPLVERAPAVASVFVSADEVHLPRSVVIGGIAGTIQARVAERGFKVIPQSLEVTIGSGGIPGAEVADVVANLRSEDAWTWNGEVAARVLGAPFQATGGADFRSKSAHVRFSGSISPRVIGVLTDRTKFKVQKFIPAFERVEVREGEAELGAGWRFERLSATVAGSGIQVRSVNPAAVTIEEGRGFLRVDRHRFYAPEAYVRVGDSFASGSYRQEFATKAFRFLLDGRLRPRVISPWFHSWWPNFFGAFGFPGRPAAASVDVQGVWRRPTDTSAFVSVDSDSPVVLGQPLKRVKTTVFVRPGFYNALEVTAIGPAGGVATGNFTLTTIPGKRNMWRTFDVTATSGMALAVAQRIGGERARPILGAFRVANLPEVELSGHFEGPGMGTIRHRKLDLTAHTKGEFDFHDFPLSDVSFTSQLRDDDLEIQPITGRFAGGVLEGSAKLTGIGSGRHISFRGTLNNASLGLAVDAVQQFGAARNGLPKPPPGKFVEDKINVHLDGRIAAQGTYGEPWGYHGGGHVALRGPEIGELPLFGPLSQLLKFTALRFTTAASDFSVDGTKLGFPNVALRGANSAIDAHGTYLLDRKLLDFRAKVFPFQESGNVIKSVVGAVLSPISNFLEVKLAGTLDKPDWAFVIGPSNLLRSLGPPPASGSAPGATPGERAAPAGGGAARSR